MATQPKKLHGGKKGKRSARHQASGKYARQFARTTANQRRTGKTNKKTKR